MAGVEEQDIDRLLVNPPENLALVFALIRVRKHWWDNITQGKQ